ncbi:MAG: DUF1064 domain-containing protein [Ignavibacteriae bacterium]|nr:DUF1064 domain-containing protein [Ignavibacteriota bacterium]
MYHFQRRWSNSKTHTYNGFQYDSGFEASYAQELDLRIKAKDIKSYERQVTLELIVNGYIVCTYRIDFIIHHKDGTLEYIECKGYATDYWRLKWKLFEALYSNLPNTKLTIIQQGKFRLPKPRKAKIFQNKT